MRDTARALGLALVLLPRPAPAAEVCAPRLAGPVELRQAAGSVVAADLDRDGIADLATIDDAGEVLILSGSASGDLTRRPTGLRALALEQVVDFDGNGTPDLFATTPAGLSVFLGDGTRRFRDLPLPGIPALAPGSFLLGDVNGDGALDLVVGRGDAAVAVLAGDGTGRFTGSLPEPAPFRTVHLLLADLDRDGRLDAVVASSATGSEAGHVATLSVLHGDGRGGFAPSVLPADPRLLPDGTLGAGDLDGDGHLDLVVGSREHSGGPWIDVLWGDGLGAFPTSTRLARTPETSSFAVTDWDGDGLTDLVLGDFASNVSLVSGTRSRVFAPARRAGSGAGAPLVAADLNGDGRPDVVGRSFAGGHAVALYQLCGAARFSRTFVVPVVLAAGGAAGSTYETELTLTNHGDTDSGVDLSYVAAFGTGSGGAHLALPAGRQLVLRSVIEELRRLGVPIPAEGNRGGSLRVRFTSLAGPSAATTSARVLAEVPGSRAGVGFPALPIESARNAPAVVPWLHEDASERTNLAIENAGEPDDGDVALRVTLVSTDPAVPGARELPEIRLAPGEFRQIDRVLAAAALGSRGWARVERVSGAAPWIAYAVVNDDLTSDESIVPAASEPPATSAEMPFVEGGGYDTELVLTNPGDATENVLLFLRGPEIPAALTPLAVDVPARGQVVLPSVVEAFRAGGGEIGPAGPLYAGTLSLHRTDAVRGVLAVGRTTTRRTNGRYGVAYAARPVEATTPGSVWLDGLRQDDRDRTNLAIAADAPDRVYEVTIYDGDTGKAVTTVPIEVPRHWTQIDRVLERFAPGVTNGYARVSLEGGGMRGSAYAVVNDGSAPGRGTGDGTLVPMWPDSLP